MSDPNFNAEATLFLQGGTVDPRSFLSSYVKGTIYAWVGDNAGSGTLWQKEDSLYSANWVIIGGSPVFDWSLAGNAGPGYVLGLTTANDLNIITSNLIRGGFKASGEQFLKTHSGFAGSENLRKTNAIKTTNAALTTIFAVPVPVNTLLKFDVSIQGQNPGGDYCGFERAGLVQRAGGAPVLGSKVHFPYTEKTDDGFDVSILISGNSLIIAITGLVATDVYWSGTLETQSIGNTV